jgi:hypothetical protein
MPHIEATVQLPVDADTVWRHIGSFQRVDWHPLLASVEGQGEQPGALRKPRDQNGQEQLEKLLEVSPSEHFYRYAIVSTPLPAKDWVDELRVKGNLDDTSTVVWTADFTVDAREEAKTVAIVRGFLDAGLKALQNDYSFTPAG